MNKTICPKCKKPVDENDDYHTLHEDNCGYEVNGFCFCDLIFHAKCCPECNTSNINRRKFIKLALVFVAIMTILAICIAFLVVIWNT